MATGRTDRSTTKALHNFTMPRELRWGNQKHLRCMKVNSGGRIAPFSLSAAVESCSPDRRRRENPVKHRRSGGDGGRGREKDSYSEFLHGSHGLGRAPPPAAWDGGRRFCGGDDGIAALREKVMLDLRTEADRMKCAIFKDGLDVGKVPVSPPLPPPSAPTAAEGEIDRPWNLRTRRAACGTPARRSGSSLNGDASAAGGGGENDSAGVEKGLMVDALKPDSGFPQMRAAGSVVDKSLRLRSSGGGTAAIGEKRERSKFAVALSKSEIEEDFFGMTGHRPARRPKKRARNVQRQLDTLFPGLWLTEITADMYKVAEAAP
ncbi:hypothetical protein PHJA_000680300 [Phtheirospermum japonicum]|uniref:DUF1639 family protein n=1 Tax=Phtheirospermum japonicum TaxID=374723 RepID=A0A830BEK0_9LAMI|nr:hypothetical protein PHJA_000680300 [Phtheirospermum japonicum]